MTTKTHAKVAKVTETATPELDVNTWHRRLAHLGEDNVRKLAKLVEGLKIKVGTQVGVCGACLEGKQHRQPSHTPATRAKEALELIHSDLCGPIKPTTFGGAKYFVLFIDDYTRMTHIYGLKGKSSRNVLERFKEYKAEVENQLDKKIKRIRTDGGGEYEKIMRDHLKGSGIIHETTTPYSPDQNGVAERANRTIVERVKAILAEANLDKRLWMELANTIVYLKNCSPTSAVVTTPYELWNGVKPNLIHLRILGSAAYIHVPKEKRTKLDTYSHKGILVGYGGTNQYRVWDLTRKDVVVSRDVRFDEGVPGSQTATINEGPKIIHDSITVLPGPPSEGQLSSATAENSEAESETGIDSENEEPEMEQQILQQFAELNNEPPQDLTKEQLCQRGSKMKTSPETTNPHSKDRQKHRSKRRGRAKNNSRSSQSSHTWETVGASYPRRI